MSNTLIPITADEIQNIAAPFKKKSPVRGERCERYYSVVSQGQANFLGNILGGRLDALR